MWVKLGISGIFHNEANRGDRQAAPALSCASAAISSAVRPVIFTTVSRSNASASILGNAQRLGMLSFLSAFKPAFRLPFCGPLPVIFQQ